MRQWYYREFKPYIAKQKIKILKDDYKFIEDILSEYPEITQREALRGYVKEWNAIPNGLDKNALERDNGRFRANTWLRENYKKPN